MVKVTGLPDFAGTLAGWWNRATTPRIFDAILAGVPVGLKLVPDTADSPRSSFRAIAYIDGSLDVSATGAVSFAGTWDAADNWTMAPVVGGRHADARAQVRGAVGFVTWSYYRAASVRISSSRGRSRISATAAVRGARRGAGAARRRSSCRMRSSSRASRLLFVVPTQKGDMVWPITDLEIKDRTVTATLGTPQ